MKLFYKQSLIATLPLILMGVVSTFTTHLGELEILNQVNARAQDSLRLHKRNIRSFFDMRIAELKTLSASPIAKSNKHEAIIQYLNLESQRLSKEIERLYKVDLKGLVLLPNGNSINVSDRDYFPRMQRGETVITRILKNRDSGRQVVGIAVPHYDEQGQLIGSIGASILVETLIDQIKNVRIGQNGFAALIDHNNQILAAGIADDNEALNSLSKLATSGQQKGTIFINGKAYFAYMSRIDTMGWQLVLMFDKTEAFAIPKKISQISFILLSVTILIAFGFSSLFSRRIVRPVNELLQIQRRFGEGDRRVRAVELADDEIGELGRSFNQMANSLAQKDDDRHETNQTLYENNELLRNLIDNSTAVIYVKSAIDGRYILVNSQFEKMAGTKADRIINKTDNDIFSEAIAKTCMAGDDFVICNKQVLESEDHLQLNEGTHTYLSIKFPLLDAKGNVYATGGIFTDITDRKKSELEILRQREQLQLVLNSVMAQIWYLDIKGRVKELNNVALRENQISNRASVTGKYISDVLQHWDFPEERFHEGLDVIDSNWPIRGSIESYQIAGQTRWVSVDKVPTHNDGKVNGLLIFVYDITDLKKIEEALRQNEDRYKAFIINSSEGIWRFDLDPPIPVNLSEEEQLKRLRRDTHLVECNEAMTKMYGYSHPDEMIGMSTEELLAPDSGSDSIRKFIKNNYKLSSYETQEIDKNGHYIWFRNSVSGFIEQGRLVRIWGTQSNITELKNHMEALEYQASHDALTNLPNRKYLYSELNQSIKNSQQNSDQQIGLLLIDLDRFKEINDTLGHHSGDLLLKQIGPRLKPILSSSNGILSRLGGDEFAILIPITFDYHALLHIVEKIRLVLKIPFDMDGFKVEIGASIGIALYPDHGLDVTTLMRCADVAMYNAKRLSRGYTLYDQENDQHSTKRLALVTELGTAIRENQLFLDYQPIICLRTQRVMGLEALIRWRHPVHGLIPPGQFIPVAEMSEIVKPLTLWVLNNALKQWHKWAQDGINISIAVNLSARNLLDEEMPELIANLIVKHKAQPKNLEIEITESAIMSDPARAQTILENINSMGINLAIDDFGTGYSSLSHLRKLPIKILKIDHSFVSGMHANEQDRIIVQSTINLAHNLGLEVVAEGVANSRIQDMLTEYHCDYAQGSFIYESQDADQITSWLKKHSEIA